MSEHVMDVNEIARLHAVCYVFQLAIMTTAVGMDSKVNKEVKVYRGKSVKKELRELLATKA